MNAEVMVSPAVAAKGFFWCAHCGHVVEPARSEIEAGENGPEGRLAGLQCPRCHRRAVEWRSPALRKPRPEPVPLTAERASELIAQFRREQGLI